MILHLVAGGIQRDASNGVRFTLGAGSSVCVHDTTVHAPVAGLRGLEAPNGGGATYETHLPHFSNDGTGWIAANASRLWAALHFEYSYDDLGAANNEWQDIASIHGYAAAQHDRVLRLNTLQGSTTPPAGDSGTANAAVTTTNTSLTDTRKAWTVDQWIGKWCCCNGKKLKVTSNTATTVNGTGWVPSGGNPGNGYAYQVCDLIPQWIINADGGTYVGGWNAVYDAGVTHVYDLVWVPTAAGVQNAYLYVDGVLRISGTAGQVCDPSTMVVKYLLTTATGGAKGASTGFVGNVQWYNCVLYDNLAGAYNTYPLPYDADPAKRIFVTHRVPIAGAPQYDAWTKSAGSDAWALIDEAPNADYADYISTTVQEQQQSWKLAAGAICDREIHDYDGVKAIQTAGLWLGYTGPAAVVTVSHHNGSVGDAGQAITVLQSTVGYGALPPLWYCANLDPAGNAWTPAAADLCQSVITATVMNSSITVYQAHQFILVAPGTPVVEFLRRRPENTLVRM